ncbi:TPA: cellulose biosynthesis protein BcsO, partial [Klebsiella quasipneumoniae subsp. quasipneumoniae]|nr:cellulose biosynthesis protein BcsO [Klebsiella quasipneumoniae subsp. quasipneumoniae]
MNHYDDLQRFQEKTRTQNLKFQDLSSQAATREHGDWAILNQLNPGAEKPSSLALGGSVSAPLPQSVPADLFRQVEAAVAAAPASDP